MNLGFDIDGVLIDVQTFMFEEGCRFLKTSIKNPDGEDIAELFDVPQNVENKFWAHHILSYSTSTPPVDICPKF